jgi:hypothetical protein
VFVGGKACQPVAAINELFDGEMQAVIVSQEGRVAPSAP